LSEFLSGFKNFSRFLAQDKDGNQTRIVEGNEPNLFKKLGCVPSKNVASQDKNRLETTGLFIPTRLSHVGSEEDAWKYLSSPHPFKFLRWETGKRESCQRFEFLLQETKKTLPSPSSLSVLIHVKISCIVLIEKEKPKDAH